MIRKHSIIFLITLVFIIALFIGLETKKQRALKEFKIETFKRSNGWGYDIKLKNKILIHQELIPSIAGNQRFHSEMEAKKVACLVIKKLERKTLPTIYQQELDSLGISYFSD
jgi:hypothetical protein